MTRTRLRRIGVASGMRSVPLMALFLWACLWLNLNTGFWNIDTPSTSAEWQLLIRAVLPFGVLPIAGAVLVIGRWRPTSPAGSPLRLLTIYGLLAAIASLFSPEPGHSLYWSAAYMATVATAYTFTAAQSPILSARQMLQVTWAVTFMVAAIIAYTARGLVFGSAPSAYDIAREVEGLSRSSGVARWAAVPGLVCILKAWHSRRPLQIALFLAAAGAAFFIVFRMQSRGAVFGSAAALLFALLTAKPLRRYALPFIIVTAVVLASMQSPAVLSGRVSEYLQRGQSVEEFRSMTGRTRAYEHGLAAFGDAPLLGRGQWADRLVIGEHVHNSYLQALLNAGIVGAVPYLASWIAGWLLFFRIQKNHHLLTPEDREAVLEAGIVMMFFTVRSIPETTTASFAVDLLIMAAVYAYLEALAVGLKSVPTRRRFLNGLPVGAPAAAARIGMPQPQAASGSLDQA